MNGEPLRLRCVKALSTLIETVAEDSNSASFAHTLAGRVFRGRNIFGPADLVPMISILEVPVPPEQLPPPTNSEASSGDWDLLIQGFCKDDPENPTDPAYLLAADVVAVIAREKKRVKNISRTSPSAEKALLGVLTATGAPAIQNIRIGSPVCRPGGDDVSSKAYFWLGITFEMVENLDEPWG